MTFRKGQVAFNNNKSKKISAWRLGRTIRGRMDEIVLEMFKLLHDDSPRIRLETIKVLLDRGIGKISDPEEFAGMAGGPLRLIIEAHVPISQQKVIELEQQFGSANKALSKTTNGTHK